MVKGKIHANQLICLKLRLLIGFVSLDFMVEFLSLVLLAWQDKARTNGWHKKCIPGGGT
jgi:hypothetical protein